MNVLLPKSLVAAISTVSNATNVTTVTTMASVLMVALAALAAPAWATAAPVKARPAATSAHKAVAYRSVLPRAAADASATPGKPDKPAKANTPQHPDNDGSRFHYDSCGCLGS